jgi:hypothetical protein
MKIRLVQYLFLLQTALILTGCEKDIKNDNLPPFEQKLAIASFISPSDTGTFVFVSSNRRLYGELGVDELTGNLSGTISDGSQEFQMDTVTHGLYISSETMPVRYGKTYTLKITSDKGLTAEAFCKVPEKRNFDLSVDSVSFKTNTVQIDEDTFQFTTMEFLLSIADFPGERNFYRLQMSKTYYRYLSYAGGLIKNVLPVAFSEPYFTDHGQDGNRIIFNSGFGIPAPDFPGYDSVFLKIYLYNTEESYYQYHKSLKEYNNDDNPFAEATPVFTNVKGGLGIFTSYTVDSLVYRLK